MLGRAVGVLALIGVTPFVLIFQLHMPVLYGVLAALALAFILVSVWQRGGNLLLELPLLGVAAYSVAVALQWYYS